MNHTEVEGGGREGGGGKPDSAEMKHTKGKVGEGKGECFDWVRQRQSTAVQEGRGRRHVSSLLNPLKHSSGLSGFGRHKQH